MDAEGGKTGSSDRSGRHATASRRVTLEYTLEGGTHDEGSSGDCSLDPRLVSEARDRKLLPPDRRTGTRAAELIRREESPCFLIYPASEPHAPTNPRQQVTAFLLQ